MLTDDKGTNWCLKEAGIQYSGFFIKVRRIAQKIRNDAWFFPSGRNYFFVPLRPC